MAENTVHDRVGIYEAIEKERIAQDKQWGGPDHDDTHNTATWIADIVKQLGKTRGKLASQTRQEFVKVAALAVAAIESIDRQTP